MATEGIGESEMTPMQVRDLARHQPELLKVSEERGPLEGVEAEYVKDLISRAMKHEQDFAKRLFEEVEGVGAVSFSISYVEGHEDEPGINIIFEGADGERLLLGEIARFVDGDEETIAVQSVQSTDPEDLEYIRPEDDLWDPVVGVFARAVETLESED
ncbi:hypothetical protein HGB25_02900 [Candidatus Saccharibacteria bacterium]|nr:hypothetical protein [Candidatus Saccharibacteria bacterium]